MARRLAAIIRCTDGIARLLRILGLGHLKAEGRLLIPSLESESLLPEVGPSDPSPACLAGWLSVFALMQVHASQETTSYWHSWSSAGWCSTTSAKSSASNIAARVSLGTPGSGISCGLAGLCCPNFNFEAWHVSLQWNCTSRATYLESARALITSERRHSPGAYCGAWGILDFMNPTPTPFWVSEPLQHVAQNLEGEKRCFLRTEKGIFDTSQ